MIAMRWHIVGLLVALVCAALLTSACGGGDDGGEEINGTPGVSGAVITATGPPTQRPRRTQSPTPAPTATPLEVCAPNPNPADPKVLQVEQPLPNTEVRIPVHVRGWGSTIGENNRGVFLGIVDAKQNVIQVNTLPPLAREFRVSPPGLEITDNTRPFAADIVLNNVTEPTPYCLWIYLSVNEEGRAQQVVQVPIVILPRQ
jgi:hypothetical protein